MTTMRFVWISKLLSYVAISTCLLASACLSAETFTPSARGGYLLPSGYLSTNGNQIIDASGTPVRIASIGWDGAEGPAGYALQGLWTTSYKTILLSIKQDGLNTVRIPWSNINLYVVPYNTPQTGTIDYTKNSDLRGLNTMQIFQKVVSYSKSIGLKVIFDHHTDDGSGGQQPNGLWIDKGPGTDGTDGNGVTGTVDAGKFQSDWVRMARTFAGNSTVIGFDLDNEPLEISGGAHWGDGGPTDIQAMYQTVGNAIQAVDPGALIIAEGPIAGAPLYGADLEYVGIAPVTLNISNKVVYSVHEYPSEIGGQPVDSGPDFVTNMNNRWGYIEGENIAPVWIGEMGSNMLSSDSQAWAGTLLPYLNGQDPQGPSFSGHQQPISTSYWEVGYEDPSGNPDGTQTAWGLGNYKPEQQAVTDPLLFKPR